MSSKYKYTGPITSNHQQRDFKRWIIVYADGEETCFKRQSYAIMVAKFYLEEGDDIHLYEETVFKNFCNNQYWEDSFRIEMTERIKYEILAEKLKKYMKQVNNIDLGLPSGTLWADRNLGADTPEKTGDYFRFGETTPFMEESSEYVYDDINGSIVGTERDAATVILGKNYRTPTIEQIQELINECKWEWVQQNGMKVTGPNGNSIFLPASGLRHYSNSTLTDIGSKGFYWSISVLDRVRDIVYGRLLYFNSSYKDKTHGFRANGLPIRPVTKQDNKEEEK